MRLPALPMAAALLSLTLSSLLRAENKVIPIWPEGVPGLKADAAPELLENERVSKVHTPTLTYYPAPADKANGTAVIVCPGGGYVRLSVANEGAKVCEWLNSLGVSAFMLHYRMVEYGHPAPLRDVLRSIRLVRSQAADFGVKPDRIGIVGFSAGGHLASSAVTLFDAPEGKTGAELDKVSARPDFAMLIYPVITMKLPFVHKGSRDALLGKDATPEMIEALSTETRVTPACPPCFLVSTEEDKTVPVENTLMFYQALRAAKVPVEMHLYEKGPHGFGMAGKAGQASEWTKRAEEFMQARGWLTKS